MILRLHFACKIAATATGDNLGQRATHAERCHWSEGLGCHCTGKASHNASNARNVTAGKMGNNSSTYNIGSSFAHKTEPIVLIYLFDF